MKKFLSLLLCMMALLQMRANMLKISNEQILLFGNVEKETMETFCIPDDDEVCQPSRLFAALRDTAGQTGASIVRSMFLDGDKPGRTEIVKYVLLEGNSSYCHIFDMEDGRMLEASDTQEENCPYFISTKKAGGQWQCGTIHSDMELVDVTVRPLGQQSAYYKPDGLYYAQLPSGATLPDFLQALRENIKGRCGCDVDVADLEGAADTTGIPYTDLGVSYILLAVTALFTLLFAFYYLLQKKREISIMQLMGIRQRQIFARILLVPLLAYPASLLAASLAAGVAKGDVGYVAKLSGTPCIAYIFLVLVFSAAFFMVGRRQELLHAVKGNTYTKGIYALNVAAELACILCLVYTGQSIYADIVGLGTEKAMHADWEVAGDYGVFYPYYIGNELTAAENSMREKAINTDFYKYANNQGALYVNALQYEASYMELNGSAIMHPYERSIQVNPNYLETFPVFDESGKAISIPESESRMVLLVPGMYKEYGQQILDFYQNRHKDLREIDEDVYGADVNGRPGEEATVIWTQDGQSAFCFNTKVVGDQGSYVMDPVIWVLTEQNSYVSERNSVLGNGNSDPLKVRLDGDSKRTYESMSGILKQLGLDDNLKALVSVDEQVMGAISETNARLALAVRLAAAIVAAFIFLLYQGTALNFNRNKKDYMVKKLFGWRWREIYGKYCVGKLSIICVTALLYGAFTRFGHGGYLAFVSLFLLAVQTAVIWICTKHQEHKRLQDVLKGA